MPVYIISIIPFSYIGLFLSFTLFPTPFDQGGYASLLLLGGITVNSLIYLVNDFLYYKKSLTHNNAIREAMIGKARPIIITTLTTCFSLISFLILGPDQVFWFALAKGTISGLLFSLFAIFLIFPSLHYKLDEDD
jgi:multidrug efflux pump subunit AcrB